MIQWHEVTWYSRLGATILFLGVVPALCFYIGTQYGAVIDQSQVPNPMVKHLTSVSDSTHATSTKYCIELAVICPTGTHPGGQCNLQCLPNSVAATSTDHTTAVGFAASPTSGVAPLKVTFFASNLSPGTYAVSFNDPTEFGDVTRFFNPPINTAHIYTQPGTYTVTLGVCDLSIHEPPGACFVSSNIGTTTITVK